MPVPVNIGEACLAPTVIRAARWAGRPEKKGDPYKLIARRAINFVAYGR